MCNFHQVDRMIHWGMLNYCFKFIANRNCEIKRTWNCKTIVKGMWNWLFDVMTINLWHLRNISVCQKYVFGLLNGNEWLCTEFNLFGIIRSSVWQFFDRKMDIHFQGDVMFHYGMCHIHCQHCCEIITMQLNFPWEDNAFGISGM